MAKYVLGKKQSSKNEDFVKAWNNIEQLISREEAERLVANAVSDIKAKTAGKNVAYAWSGGKDSLALQVVCERAGINKCVLCTASKIEYPGFVDWCKAHAPKGLTIVDNPKLDIKYVADHPDMLFPVNSKYAAQWFHILQHRGQAIYFKEQHLGKTEGEVRIMRGLTDKQKLKIVIEDNKIQSMSYVDFTKIEEIIKEVGELDIIGFGTDYLDAIINESLKDNMGVDFSQPVPKPQSNEKQVEDIPQEKRDDQDEERDDIESGMQPARTMICPHCGKEIIL